MSELQDIQRAGVRVLNESKTAFERGELTDDMALGIRLVVVSLMMKAAHQPDALKIAREYAEAVGLDFDFLMQQMEARIYEQVQIDRLEGDLSGGES